MGWTADTQTIFADTIGHQPTVFLISSISHVYSANVAMPRRTATVVDTATGLVMDVRGQFIRDARGDLVEVSRKVFFLPTATCAVGYRLTRSGSSEYEEVVSVLRFDDHLEVYTKEVGGR